ncbi:MAG: FAD-dependent oxidoreductase [Sphingomonas sp.]|uniref:flavin monoamine oxidase family protein n=1 Tax=Sphingomonas sp. TaxID=28214 RepID=UPI0025E1C0C9|nr:NAD(P)/FAD-dependent oxidoreductase [Sphingomonas sp.]MBX3564359.1 FAD-dependent oxidoreductase [Sphingomonas sp.]
MHDVEIAVIGGGAAGISAARTLADAGRSVLLIEGSDRLGGRAHTVSVGGLPLDLGAGWLHSAQHNPWVAIAEASGFTVDRTLPRWREQWRELGFSRADQQAARQAFEDFDQRLRTVETDCAADALIPGGEWNPYLEALSGFINSAGWPSVSVADYLAYMDAATDTDWRVEQGYGAMIAAHAARLPVAFSTPVTAIDRSGTRLRLDTPRGTIAAEAAIVTISTNVLSSGAITLPGHDAILHAASQLPLGLADKLFLALDDADEIPANAHLLGNPRAAKTGSYTLRPFGRPVIEVMYGGEGAAEMERRGLDGAAAFAIDELTTLMGSAWRGKLRLLAGSCWGRTDHILGGYSHALPGHTGARKTLTIPIDERIRFAGEACSETEFSTAHGARKTGVAAAQALL